jgi:hypothetical protein
VALQIILGHPVGAPLGHLEVCPQLDHHLETLAGCHQLGLGLIVTHGVVEGARQDLPALSALAAAVTTAPSVETHGVVLHLGLQEALVTHLALPHLVLRAHLDPQEQQVDPQDPQIFSVLPDLIMVLKEDLFFSGLTTFRCAFQKDSSTIMT